MWGNLGTTPPRVADLLNRDNLKRAVKYFSICLGFACVYVLLDFMLDVRPPQIHDSYRFELGELPVDSAVILKQDNLAILVIKRSDATLHSLEQATEHLQDPNSISSRQPDAANNKLRAIERGYFVSYAVGTDLGCMLIEIDSGLQEVCGSARYDFAGRALKGNKQFQNLPIPDYNFSNGFNTLTIRP